MTAIALDPRPGRLSARVFQNPSIGIQPALFFDIEIPLEPFEFDGEIVDTAVQLGFIRVPVTDWREIEGQEYRFPVNPEPGYIDGSLYLAGVHNPADATCIRFGRVDGDSISADFEITFDFEYEGPVDLGTVDMRWVVPLHFDAGQLDAAVVDARRAGAITH